jgi:hypothetical protein
LRAINISKLVLAARRKFAFLEEKKSSCRGFGEDYEHDKFGFDKDC